MRSIRETNKPKEELKQLILLDDGLVNSRAKTLRITYSDKELFYKDGSIEITKFIPTRTLTAKSVDIRLKSKVIKRERLSNYVGIEVDKKDTIRIIPICEIDSYAINCILVRKYVGIQLISILKDTVLKLAPKIRYTEALIGTIDWDAQRHTTEQLLATYSIMGGIEDSYILASETGCLADRINKDSIVIDMSGIKYIPEKSLLLLSDSDEQLITLTNFQDLEDVSLDSWLTSQSFNEAQRKLQFDICSIPVERYNDVYSKLVKAYKLCHLHIVNMMITVEQFRFMGRSTTDLSQSTTLSFTVYRQPPNVLTRLESIREELFIYSLYFLRIPGTVRDTKAYYLPRVMVYYKEITTTYKGMILDNHNEILRLVVSDTAVPNISTESRQSIENYNYIPLKYMFEFINDTAYLAEKVELIDLSGIDLLLKLKNFIADRLLNNEPLDK